MLTLDTKVPSMGKQTSLGGPLSLSPQSEREGLGQVTLTTVATIISRCSRQVLCWLSSCITSFH